MEAEGYRVTTDQRFNSTTKWCLPRNVHLTRLSIISLRGHLPTLSHVGASKRGEREGGRKEERYLYFGSGKRAKEGERIAVPVPVSVVYGLGRQFTLVGGRLRGHRRGREWRSRDRR